ncbi:MAG: hypothetical protein ACR2QJ_16600 [Geminicoccaceae bacterium]
MGKEGDAGAGHIDGEGRGRAFGQQALNVGLQEKSFNELFHLDFLELEALQTFSRPARKRIEIFSSPLLHQDDRSECSDDLAGQGHMFPGMRHALYG